MTQEVKTLLIIGVVTLVLVVGGIFLLGRGGSSSSEINTPIDTKLLVRADSDKIATDSAKVTVVEFGDFECPACGAAQPVTKQVIDDYKGKIDYVFRNFPLPQHDKALIAAEAAEAAGAQGKYWEMHDKLYETQDTWSVADKPLDLFVQYAQSFGLDVNKFRDDVTNNKYQAKITQDFQDGTAVGIRATPTFFIAKNVNGGLSNPQKLEGVPTYEQIKALIDSKLTN